MGKSTCEHVDGWAWLAKGRGYCCSLHLHVAEVMSRMRFALFLFLQFILLLCPASAAVKEAEEWRLWKAKYGKAYLSIGEQTQRQKIWLLNRELVKEHNSKESTFELELNWFADMTAEEFASIYNGYGKGQREETQNTTIYRSTDATVPDSVDWRTKGLVTPVKNQGDCGSCWAFSTTGSLEGAHAKKTGRLVSLSEQNLVDCDKGDHGCEGGLMKNAFEYIRDNKGIDTEASYPYKAKKGHCEFKEADIGATVRRHVSILTFDCWALKDAVANVGPISVGMDASHGSFQLYKSGIYDPTVCSKTKLDHGVLVVGYGSENGKEYWIVKNSWGTRWGMEGYFKIAAKSNVCGICTSACYPVV